MRHVGASRSSRRRWAAATALVVVLVACGGDDGGDEDDGGSASSDTSAPPASSDTTEPEGTEPASPEDEVLADYEAAIAALEDAYAVPDPDHPDLIAHWSGEALTHLQASLDNYVLNGQAGEGTVDLHPQDVEFDPEDEDLAWVTDCFRDRSQIVDAETREPIGEPSETVAATKRRLERIDGTWVVMKDEIMEVGGCTPPES